MGVFGTTFAINPARMAVSVVFFFPDRQSHLDLIDNVPTGIERLVPVRRRYADPDGAIADVQHAGPVNTVRMKDRELGAGFGNDFFAFGDGDGLI